MLLIVFFPNFVPSVFFIDYVDIVTNSNTTRRYGDENFVLNQLFKTEEERLLYNQSMGIYSSNIQRASLASSSNIYYVQLCDFFKQGKIPMLFQHSDIQYNLDYVPYPC